MLRERHRPGQVAHVAVAAAVQEAAEPSQGDPQRQGRGDHVEHRPERERAERPVEEERGGPPHDAPVQDDPPFPDLEDVPDAVDPDPPVLEDVEEPGADQAADEDPERQVVDHFGVELLAAGAPGGEVHRAQEGEEEHQAVAENLDSAQDREREQDLPHAGNCPS